MIVECKLELAKAIIAAREARETNRDMIYSTAIILTTEDEDIRDLLTIMLTPENGFVFYCWARDYIASYRRHVEPRHMHQGKD